MYRATTGNEIVTQNYNILPDRFTSLKLQNIGDCDAVINDNIPLPAGSVFFFENHPDCRINENTFLRFVGAGLVKKILIIKYYYE